MSEALAISAANLDVIEKNLGSVAEALTGVMTDVSVVNTQVSNVENRVHDLNDELKKLVKEVRENSILTNARQSIMYNNDQIEKKYSYYDSVRRMAEGFLDSIQNSNLRKKTLFNLREQLVINNPNYWLSNALSALSSWALNDKNNTDKEVLNSLKKDEIKTSIFFSLINLKLGRQEASINWLKYYLNRLNPYNLSSEFVTVLDLVTAGQYGIEGKNIIITKINEWYNILINDKNVVKNEVLKCFDYISQFEILDDNYPYIKKYSSDSQIIINNLLISSSYEGVLNSLKDINLEKNESKTIDSILRELIYEYEDNEQVFQKDNFRNRLIIECNGDIEKATELFKKHESVYSNKVDILSLFTNIVLFKKDYNISNETQKLALSYIKKNILDAYEIKNSYLVEGKFNITMDNFNTTIKDDINREKIDKEIDIYLKNEFKDNDKTMYGFLLMINIVGIIGIFITFNNKVLLFLILLIMIIGNIMLIYKIISQTSMIKKSKEIKKEGFKSVLDLVLAEYTDYKNIIDDNKEKYSQLKKFISSLDISSYTKSSDGRDIKIGD